MLTPQNIFDCELRASSCKNKPIQIIPVFTIFISSISVGLKELFRVDLLYSTQTGNLHSTKAGVIGQYFLDYKLKPEHFKY